MSSKIRSLKRERERREAKDSEIVVTLGQLINSAMQTEQNPQPALYVLLSRPEIPIATAHKIGKITRHVAEEIKSYQESYKALCEKYANKDGDKPRIVDAEGKLVAEGQPGRYDIPKERDAEFQKEHNELVALEVSLPGQTIKVSELQGVRIAPMYTMALDWLLTE